MAGDQSTHFKYLIVNRGSVTYNQKCQLPPGYDTVYGLPDSNKSIRISYFKELLADKITTALTNK